jgi:hypothetical protein
MLIDEPRAIAWVVGRIGRFSHALLRPSKNLAGQFRYRHSLPLCVNEAGPQRQRRAPLATSEARAAQPRRTLPRLDEHAARGRPRDFRGPLSPRSAPTVTLEALFAEHKGAVGWIDDADFDVGRVAHHQAMASRAHARTVHRASRNRRATCGALDELHDATLCVARPPGTRKRFGVRMDDPTGARDGGPRHRRPPRRRARPPFPRAFSSVAITSATVRRSSALG